MEINLIFILNEADVLHKNMIFIKPVSFSICSNQWHIVCGQNIKIGQIIIEIIKTINTNYSIPNILQMCIHLYYWYVICHYLSTTTTVNLTNESGNPEGI